MNTPTPQEEAERIDGVAVIREHLQMAVPPQHWPMAYQNLAANIDTLLTRISTLERKLKGAEEALEQISNHVIGDTNGNAKPSVASQIALKTLTAIREEDK